MTHMAFQPAGEVVEFESEYVVVGSGPGGAAAAITLARGGADVTIVEAGAWRDPEHYPSTAFGGMRDLMDDWGATITRGRALWPIVQARAVGGTSVINSAICVRTPGDIFEQWTAEHGLDGEAMSAEVWRHQDRLEQELFVEEVPTASLGRSNELALIGGETMGYGGHVMRRYAKACQGTGQCLQGCRAGAKQSTNLNYVPEVIERGGRVLSCAPVKRVVFEGKTAIGVQGKFRHPETRRSGAKFFVRATKGVIVSASATHSPTLLQRSGIKSRALGHNFRAHPGTGVFGIYDDPVDMNIGVTQGWASTAFRKDPGLKLETLSIPLELVASRLSGAGVELMRRLQEYRHITMWCHAVRAESKGTVKNGFGDKPVVKYTLDAADMERFVAGMYLLAQTHVAAGAKAVIPGIYGLPYKLQADEIDVLKDAPRDPRNYIAILSHLFGGCVMGADDNTAVCDYRGRVFGYERLTVADASVIPTNLGVNPQHTIMALAGVFAESLLAEN